MVEIDKFGPYICCYIVTRDEEEKKVFVDWVKKLLPNRKNL